MDLQRDAERLATIATIFMLGRLAVRPLCLHRRGPVVDRPGEPLVRQLAGGLRDLISCYRRAAVPGAAGRRPGPLPPPVRPVRGQLQRVQVAAGHDPMLIRRFLALAAIAVAMSACSSGNAADATADGAGGELQATDWVLNSYDVSGALTIVPPDQYADADFRANRVTGFGGCNDYDAVYVSNGRNLFVGMPKTTLMSCGEATDAFATTYITLLQAEPLLQRPRRHPHHPRGGPVDHSRLRGGAEESLARLVDRRRAVDDTE